MAKLSAVTVAEIPEGGEWIAPGGDCDDIEFLTVGLTDKYTDAQNRRQARLAKAHGGKPENVPTKLVRKVNIELLQEHCVFGIRKLEGADGREISWEEAKAMMLEEKHRPLTDGAFAAAMLVTSRRAADLEDAAGN